MKGDHLELRCVCSKRSLLGLCGRDADGQPFVWVKIFKQGRVFGEIVTSDGVTRIRCRDCLRWHVVTVRREAVRFAEAPLPDSLPI